MFLSSALLCLIGLGAAHAAEKKVLVPGQPPLTQDMVDDYMKYLEWRSGPILAQAGGPARLARMIINDWENGDAKRRASFLAALTWWREEFPKLSQEQRQLLSAYNNKLMQDIARSRYAQNQQAIQMLLLQQAFDSQQQLILAISNIRAKGHELNMQIIRNFGPTGRYEYNPSTGRYDRYVPYR
jgi:hypothetical protein